MIYPRYNLMIDDLRGLQTEIEDQFALNQKV